MDHVREVKLLVALGHINEYVLFGTAIECRQHWETQTKTVRWEFPDEATADMVFGWIK